MSNWTLNIHGGYAAGFGMPASAGLATSAARATDFGVVERERIAEAATQAPKRTQGTQVWSPPT